MKKGNIVDGSIIKKLRKENKWTQKELSTSVMKKHGLKEFSFRTIQRIEGEEGYGCSSNVINSLSKVFGVDAKDILLPIANIEALEEEPKAENFKHFNVSDEWEKIFTELEKRYDDATFCLDEREIRYIENKLPYESILTNLRKLKFRRMVFKRYN